MNQLPERNCWQKPLPEPSRHNLWMRRGRMVFLCDEDNIGDMCAVLTQLQFVSMHTERDACMMSYVHAGVSPYFRELKKDVGEIVPEYVLEIEYSMPEGATERVAVCTGIRERS